MCKSTAGSRLSTEKLAAVMMSVTIPLLAPLASAISDPRFHNMASTAARAGRTLLFSLARIQFTTKKYSRIPKIIAPAQCPIVLTRTGSWMLSRSGMLNYTILDFGLSVLTPRAARQNDDPVSIK